ncbi:hypothetical protein RclHR1_06950001 [Rhizophagus clarus]|uniref:Uncharacterized protein n=1 Tax=Rhizophagus clarus TaxID=94130 RepID=A0A2Z6S6X5_9GLOM|nr:hypothetical protein RclHR1_06950001 [Rhizophagus clarus]
MVFQRSGIPLKTDRYFKGPEVLYRQITIWKKWTELFQRPGTLIRSGPRSRRSPDYIRRFTTSGRVFGQDFKGPEPFLRQTSYLKAHGFPNTNKRWGRIKVRVGSKKLKLFVRIKPTGTMSKPLTTT